MPRRVLPEALLPVPASNKLVSVRRVSAIKNLDSSQTHEVIMVDGWPVVVEKGQFAMKQLVLYFAIDCFFPSWNERRFEPYRFSHFHVELQGQKGWAVQTVKHQGHVSQGMAFAIDDSFPEITRMRKELEQKKGASLAEKILMGRDVKETFAVKKWRAFYPPDGGISLGSPPNFLPVNISEQAQNIPELWRTHGNTEFQITEILDGIPMTFYDITYHEGRDDFRSQLPGVLMTDEAENGLRCRETYGVAIGDHDCEETENSIGWKALREQGFLDKFLDQPELNGMGVAGVLCGDGISGNPLKINGHRFYAYALCVNGFRTWTTLEREGLTRCVRLAEWVPKFATRVRLSAFAKDFDELMKKAQGASCVSDETRKEYPSLKRKGLAFRTPDGSFSFKVIANDWLLDETEKLRKAGEDQIVSRPGPNDWV